METAIGTICGKEDCIYFCRGNSHCDCPATKEEKFEAYNTPYSEGVCIMSNYSYYKKKEVRD